jgi:ADP-heptose:LPS heptosyltransferase
MPSDKSTRRVAVYVDLDLVGDALIKLPMVRALRHAFPDAEITWIAGRGPCAYAGPLAPLVVGLLDRVLEQAGTCPDLGGRIDLLLDTQSKVRTALELRRVPARRMMTLAAWGLPGWPPGVAPGKPRHLVRRLLDLLRRATGAEPVTNDPLRLPDADQALAARLLPPGESYVAQVLGAGGKHKAWPEERHLALALALLARGQRPVLILGPDEHPRHAALAAALPEACFPLQEARALGNPAAPPLTIALAARCAAGVAGDCGGGHMLAAASIPLVSLFGPTDPAKFAPWTERLAILRAQEFGGDDMAAIPVDAVLAALPAPARERHAA